MNAQELQEKITELAVDRDYPFFALCRNYEVRPTVTNTVGPFKPSKWPGNADFFVSDLVPYVFKYPDSYVLHFRRTTQGNPPWETMAFDTRPESERTPLTEKPAPQTPPIPMDNNTQKLLEQISDLKAENARLSEVNNQLRRDITRLEEEAEALAAEADENAHATMADQTVSMVGQVAQILPVVLDKWFSLQEQKNALLAEQLRRNAPQPRPQQPQQPVNNVYHEEAGY
jgi:uncharacterized protein YdcH (DUF465 family)